jgi:hypothetical protein
LQVAQLWATNGILAAGDTWIKIDCSWASVLTNVNSNFPHGVTNCVNVAHSYTANGHKFLVGIYFGANNLPYGPPMYAYNCSNLVATCSSWGIDGIKIDGILSDPNGNPPVVEGHLYGARALAEYAIAQNKPMALDITLHPPNTGVILPDYNPEIFSDANCWEMTAWGEVQGNSNILVVADALRPILKYNQRGRCGQLICGNPAGGGSENTLTNRLNFNLAWPSYIEIGQTNLTATTYYTNRDIRNLLGDGFVAPNQEVYSNSLTRIWARPIGGYWPAQKYAVLFVNGFTTGAATSNLTVTASMLGWTNNSSILAHDPYQQADIGISNNSFTVSVKTNETALWVLSFVHNANYATTAGTATTATTASNVVSLVLTNQYYATNAIDQSGGVWSTHEEFMGGSTGGGGIGELGWNNNGAGNNNTLTGESGHPGLIRLTTGSSSGNLQEVFLGPNSTDVMGTLSNRVWTCRFVGRANVTNLCKIRLGFSIGVTTDPPGDGIWFDYNSTNSPNWQAVTKATSSTTTDTGVRAETTTWHTWTISADASGKIYFAIDGSAPVSNSTTVPSTGGRPLWWVGTFTSSACTFDADHWDFKMSP